jgi:heat shock protein HslJ
MSDGQCSPERMAADVELLNALSQATQWQKADGVVTLKGPSSLRFRPSDH